MKINYIKLVKFKRLMLSNIESFEWSPKNDLMVILGSNGGGKSSVLSRLTPLPARHVEFNKGGEVIVECSYRDDLYKMHSTYNSGTGSHSFLKNGIELNSGGTFKVQEELCFDEFGLTQEIHDIAIGKTQFSQLSTNKRRELLTKMSPVDLDYAFDIYKKVRQEHRSHKGVMDLITKRLVSENTDLPSDNEISQLQEKNKALTTRLNRLYKEKGNDITSVFKDNHEPHRRLEGIIERARGLLKTYVRLPQSVSLTGEEAFKEKVNLLTLQESNLKAIIDRLADELETSKRETPKDLEVKETDIEALKLEHDELTQQIKTLNLSLEQYRGPFPLIDLDVSQSNVMGQLDTVFKHWYGLLETFPNNEDGEMSKENATTKNERLVVLKARERTLNDNFDSNRSRISRLKGCEQVICPSCTHSFQPGVDPKEIGLLETHQEAIMQELESIRPEMKVIEEYLVRFGDYSSLVFRFMGLTKDYPQYHDLWDYCVSNRIMYRTPSYHKTDAGMWHTAMQKSLEARTVLGKLNVLDRRLAVIAEIDKDAVEYMRKRTQSLEAEVSEHYINLEEVSNQVNALRSGELSINRLISQINNVLDEYDDWRKAVTQHSEYLIDQAYEEEIKTIHLNISDSTASLNKVHQQSNTVRTLENEVRVAQDAHSELGVLIKALSPNDGLLGRYLLGFMHGVAAFVNAYIGEIWTYPLEVLPSKIEKEELDYKFPLNIGDGTTVSSDIAEASTGQLEVINFAFRMAVLKFLKLEHLPLYLDELGGTFDGQHRSNLIPFVTRLIENGHFKQIFYICHFEEIYGAFNQAEFMVVNPTNIVIPDTYNQNVIIK